jgi:hypothetical protein
MSQETRKPLMRSLGEFFGHLVKAAKSDPNKKVLRKEVEEQTRGDITLRRTTIEEIEVNRTKQSPPPRDE